MKYYTFHYSSGGRAIKSEYSFKSDMDALKFALPLAKEKGRRIDVRCHTTGWVKGSTRNVGTAYVNGEIFDGYGMIDARGKRREITEADYHYVR